MKKRSLLIVNEHFECEYNAADEDSKRNYTKTAVSARISTEGP